MSASAFRYRYKTWREANATWAYLCQRQETKDGGWTSSWTDITVAIGEFVTEDMARDGARQAIAQDKARLAEEVARNAAAWVEVNDE